MALDTESAMGFLFGFTFVNSLTIYTALAMGFFFYFTFLNQELAVFFKTAFKSSIFFLPKN